MPETRFALPDIDLELMHQGKTRDTYPAQGGSLLVYATDRLSTHNVVHQSTVPKKGEVLTALTIFWLTKVVEVDHHLVAFGQDIYQHLPKGSYPKDLHLRAIVVKRLNMIPVEFIYRNYLAGSLFEKFYSKGKENPYGVHIRPGTKLMEPFSGPVFTPTDKSETDDPLNSRMIIEGYYEAFCLALKTFSTVGNFLRKKGLELVDSKFELGIDEDGVVRLADEVATLDSSRFCRLADIKPGQEPPWLDKQVARDEAMRVWGKGPKTPLTFSPETVAELERKYVETFGLIVGISLEDFQREYLL